MKIKDRERPVRLRTTPIFVNDQISKFVIEGDIDLHRFNINTEGNEETGDGRTMFINLVLNNPDKC